MEISLFLCERREEASAGKRSLRLGACLAAVLLFPCSAVAATAQLHLLPPAEGFHRGKAAPVMLVSVDEANVATDSVVAPSVTATGASASTATRIAAGMWMVEITPSAAGPLTLEGELGAAKGTLSAVAAGERDAVLEVSLSKTTLAPGDRPAVVATVLVHDLSGALLDSWEPGLEASVGGAVALSQTSPGRWEGRLRLPVERYPQTVQVVAFVPGKEVAPARALLVMEGRASVPITTKPHSKVTVHVGKRAFGPFLADAAGEIQAEIEAAPSDASMDVVSIDAVGNSSSKTVPLDAAPYPKLWARAEVTAPDLAARTRVRVWAYLLDRRGRAIEGPRVTATLGTQVIEMRAAGGGLLAGSARAVLPPGKAEVSLGGEGGSLAVPVTIGSAAAVGISVKAAPEVIAAGGPPAGISAELVDAAGRPGAGKIALTGEGLQVGSVQALEGRATAVASLPGAALPAAAVVIARADGPGFTMITRHAMAVAAGAPVKVELAVLPEPMFADGVSSGTAVAAFADAWGNPVAGLTPDVSLSAGTATVSAGDTPGRYRILVRAPTKPGDARLAVSSGVARAESPLTFLHRPSVLALAGGASVANNLGALTSELIWLEARGAFGDGRWAGILRVSGATGSFQLRAVTQKTSLNEEVGMLGLRRFFSSPLSAWSTSVGLAAATGGVQVSRSGNNAPPGAKGGILVGGRAFATAERRIGGGAVLLEAGFSFLEASQSLVSHNIGGADVCLGYRHGF